MMRVAVTILACLAGVTMVSGLAAPGDLGQAAGPDQPGVYLELGERLVALSQTEQELNHARAVLAMGVSVHHARADHASASACCIALAHAYPSDPAMRQQLWDLALILDPSRLQDWVSHRPSEPTTRAQRDAEACLRLGRHGEADAAAALASKRGVRDVILSTGARLGYARDQVGRALDSMLSPPSRDPCRGNYFHAVVENGQSSRKVCTAHSAPLGTGPESSSLLMLLRIESACLPSRALGEDWGGAYTLGDTTAQREPTVRWLVDTLKIDTARPYLRGRSWHSSP